MSDGLRRAVEEAIGFCSVMEENASVTHVSRDDVLRLVRHLRRALAAEYAPRAPYGWHCTHPGDPDASRFVRGHDRALAEHLADDGWRTVALYEGE